MVPVDDDDVRRPPPLWPSLLTCALVAAWVDLGTIHRQQHADSLLYPLISRWCWTPFYWGQDRFGMLVPLLARPIAHPLANLLIQDFLNIFAGLATFILLARYVLRDATYPAVGALGAASFLALAPPGYQAMYFIDACYGTWLALGLGGLIAIESRPGGASPARLLCGAALIFLAHWVNFTTALVLGPLAVARWLLFERAGAQQPSTVHPEGGPRMRHLRAGLRSASGSETAVALILLASGAVVGWALARLVAAGAATPLDAVPPYDWHVACYQLVAKHWESLAPRGLPAALACAALLGLAMQVRLPDVRRQAPMAWRAAGALGVAATVIWLYTGTRLWAKVNGYTFRYLMPPALMIQAASWTVGVGPLCRAVAPAARKALSAMAATALFAAAAQSFGFPSYTSVRAEFDRRFGGMTEDLIAARCTHLAGDYARVWPAVFHAYLVLYERGEDRIIWAVTGRGEATLHLWGAISLGQVRVAIPTGDYAGRTWLKKFHFPPLPVVERRSTVQVHGLLDGKNAPRGYIIRVK